MGSSEFYCEQGLLATFWGFLVLVYCGKNIKLAPGFSVPRIHKVLSSSVSLAL